MIIWYYSERGQIMENVDKSNEPLDTFFKEAFEGSSEEEVRSIIEIQKIVEEILGPEEGPQIYQLKVTSNW